MTKDNLIWEGYVFNETQYGYGRMIWSNGTYYIGMYDKDKRDGFGT